MTSATQIDVSVLTLLLGLVLPALTALFTKRLASGTVKTLVLLVLSTLAVALQTAIDAAGGAETLDAGAVLTAVVVQFYLAVGAHFGLLRPAKITGSEGVIATTFAGGLGRAKDYDKAA